MSSNFSFEFMAVASELDGLNESVDNFAQLQHWPQDFLFTVRLVLEEIVVNVISYGATGGNVPRVLVRLCQDQSQLVMHIEDNGIVFDPLQKAAPDLDTSLEDRPIGGLGVYLVRQLTDSVQYSRNGDWNCLTVSKALPPVCLGDAALKG
jgi:anti-sigma regulatory factor (Ser/Thr protein kinase)